MKNKMREMRFFKGMTLEQLFLKTRIRPSRLSQLEREIFDPSQKEIKLIAKALGADSSEVFPSQK